MAGKQSSSPGGKDAAPSALRPDEIRNVVLVGPPGSGKTTLVETLLVSAGVLNRAGTTVDGTTVSDFDEAELRQQRSVGLALAPLMHDGVKINLLDTPGYADFVGELRAGLRAADCAMFVVAANEGVDEPTRSLWRECAGVEMPRVVVVTKLDHARADYDGVVAQARQAFGDKVVPVYLREGDALVGLITGDHAHDEQRGRLIEGVIEESEDETLMERYLGGEDVDAALLVQDLERAVARGSFHPVVPVDSSTGSGARELLDLVVAGFPSPLEHPLPEVFTPTGGRGPALECDPDGTAGRRGGEDHQRLVRRTGEPGPGVLGHRATRRDRARLGSPGGVLRRARRPGRRARGPRRGRADRRAVRAAGQGAAARRRGRRRRHLRDRAAAAGRDRRHAVGPGEPARAPAVEHAGAAAAGRDRGARQGRRGQAGAGAGAARGRGPDAADRAQRGDPPDRALDDGGGARRRGARPAGEPARRRRRAGRAAGPAAGDVRGIGGRARPARQAVRWARPVRGVRDRGGAAAGRVRLRVRGQGGRRLRAPPVHPLGGEGAARPDGARHRGRLPRGRHPGDPEGRQVAQRRLLRHGLPDRRRRWRCARPPGPAGRPCSSRSTRWPCWCPTTWSAR